MPKPLVRYKGGPLDGMLADEAGEKDELLDDGTWAYAFSRSQLKLVYVAPKTGKASSNIAEIMGGTFAYKLNEEAGTYECVGLELGKKLEVEDVSDFVMPDPLEDE